MRREDLIQLVMSFSEDVLDVEVGEVAGNVTVKVKTRVMAPDDEYNLRVGILQLLEPQRPAGVGFDVVIGGSRRVQVFNTPDEVKAAFDSSNRSPAWPSRTRFSALAEELTSEVKPLLKPDPRNKPPQIRQLFEQTIEFAYGKPTACPKCGCFAFEPNAEGTRVICRGCPLPGPPVYTAEFADKSGITTRRYKCCSCGRDSKVTMDMSQLNLYCSGCGKLSLQDLQPERPTKVLSGSKAVMKFNNITLGQASDVEIVEFDPLDLYKEEVSGKKYVPGNFTATLTLKSEGPSNWFETIQKLSERISAEYGLTYEQMADQYIEEREQTPALQLMELFRKKLGLQPFALYASTKRNENVMQEGKSMPADGSMRERGTGRTTKALLFAIAEFMASQNNAFYVTGSTERYTVQLVKDAYYMHERLNLSRKLPCRPLMPADVDPRYDYKREKSYVYIDHSYYEKLARY